MPYWFRVKWPPFALIEAALLFPVTVVAVGSIAAPSLTADDGPLNAVVSLGASAEVASFAVFLGFPIILTAVPFLGVMLIADRLLIARRGFAMLAGLASLIWAGAAAALADKLVASPPDDLLSFRLLIPLIAGAVALLAHARVLWIGVRDDGYAAMRLGVERRVKSEQRIMRFRYLTDEELAAGREDPGPLDPGDRANRRYANDPELFLLQLPLGVVLIFVIIGAWIFVSYEWIFSGQHKQAKAAAEAAARSRSNGAILAHNMPVFHVPVSDGAAIAMRDDAGRFVFVAVINGIAMRMTYDDDVPMVTLRAEDAQRLGISFGRLDFSSTIRTPGGPIEVAGITINSMTVGSITYKLVPGFVARPGALKENLLGHSFLGRLTSYQIDDDRLILSGPRGATR